jgi:hypothetical protein
VTVEDKGLRYEPLWHAKAHVHLVYDCRETYHVVPRARHAKSVTVGNDEYQISAGKQPAIDVRAVEHCERDERKELWLDAVSNKPVASRAYAEASAIPVELAALASEGANIVEPKVRASGAIRMLLGEDFRPVDADSVTEETIDVECVDLCLRPVYGFRYAWAAKNKDALVSIDGITGEIKAGPPGEESVLGKLLQPETLFDLGAETLNVIVPGGAIALKIARALADKRQSK